MNKFSSIFGQILQIFSKHEFCEAVQATGANHGEKGFTCWQQFVGMMFCQLGQAQSLREICGGLASCLGKLKHLGVDAAPSRSTLSYANEHRTWQLYREIFYQLLVTRLKDNADFSVGQVNPAPANRNILSDQIIQFVGFSSRRKCPDPLRMIKIWDEENEQVIVLLTNHLKFGSTTIAAGV
jgi:Domain of unknown function (DUF4372)